MEALLIGLLYVILYVLIAAICVWLIIWVLGLVGFAPPPIVQNLLWAVVAVLALILIVQLLFGVVHLPARPFR